MSRSPKEQREYMRRLEEEAIQIAEERRLAIEAAAERVRQLNKEREQLLAREVDRKIEAMREHARIHEERNRRR